MYVYVYAACFLSLHVFYNKYLVLYKLVQFVQAYYASLKISLAHSRHVVRQKENFLFRHGLPLHHCWVLHHLSYLLGHFD